MNGIEREKKRILFIYSAMILGGSTNAMLSLMNSLDPQKYDIELQLFKNEGPLMEMIPAHVKVLPEAQKYNGKRWLKWWKFFSSGYLLRAVWRGIKRRKKFSREILADFGAMVLSRENTRNYDYGIGYLEGWSDRYLAWKVKADHKYAWIHSTFANVTSDPEAEALWMKDVDRIVFVTESCKDGFVETLPDLKDKAIVIENLVDSELLRKRSEMVNVQDAEYQRLIKADCFKIVTVCRLQIQTKGLDRIIRAAKHLKENDAAMFLWYIIGSGEDEAELKQLVQESGLEDRIVLTGARMNPYPFIEACDMMCMPSRYEGKPLAITESMILGVPPLVTKYLSAHEQIQNGVDGVIVANEDDSIVEALDHFMNYPEKVDRMRDYLLAHEYGNRDKIYEIERKLF